MYGDFACPASAWSEFCAGYKPLHFKPCDVDRPFQCSCCNTSAETPCISGDGIRNRDANFQLLAGLCVLHRNLYPAKGAKTFQCLLLWQAKLNMSRANPLETCQSCCSAASLCLPTISTASLLWDGDSDCFTGSCNTYPSRFWHPTVMALMEGRLELNKHWAFDFPSI